MPTYQYSCTECGHFFEQFQSFSEDSLTECPQCQGRLRKVFNAVGVVFKGSGFYRTDSRASSGDSSEGSAGRKDATPEKKPAAASSDSSTSGGSSSGGSSSGGGSASTATAPSSSSTSAA